MGVFNNFPYANFHELNADWIIEQVREVKNEWEEYKADMDLWKLGVDDQLAAFQAWFDNLDVQDEVRTVINELIQSGEFIEIAGPQIVSATEAWLAAHITPTTPAVDDTLSISGAAADAKVTGDRISDLKEDINKDIATFNGSDPITYDHKDAYIKLNDATADVTNFQTLSGYECTVVSCTPGDLFNITAQGQNATRAYAFVSSNGTIIEVANANVTLTNKLAIAPAGSAYFVSNNRYEQFHGYVFKGFCVNNAIMVNKIMTAAQIATDGANLHSGKYLHNSLLYVQDSNLTTLYADELPAEFINANIVNMFVMTFNYNETYYEQFIYNNGINKIYYRVFNANGYTVLRDWTLLLESATVEPYLYQKQAIILGDSISYGLYSYWDNGQRKNSDGLSPDYAQTRISDYFANLGGMAMTNIAARATGYVADPRALGNALVKANATDFSNYDFVGLCFGINDYIQNKPIGTISGDTEGTVVGNLMRVLKKIYTDNPLAKVVIFSPYNAWGQVAVNQGANELYGDESTNYALGFENSAHYTLQDLVDAIDEVSDYYGVTHERLNKSNIINRLTIKDILIDGLHPSRDSMPMLAAEMFAQKDFG